MPDLPILPDGTDWGEAQLTPILNAINALPRGRKASVMPTLPHNGITAAVNVNGLAVTWTAEAGRRYKITASAIVLQNAAGGIVDFRIANGAGSTAVQSSISQGVSEYATHTVTVEVDDLPAGSQTWRVRAATTGGNCNVQMTAGAPGFMMVEDIGT